MRERIATLESANAAKDKTIGEQREELVRLRAQLAVQGDGSCDHCGKVPAIIMPTSLCDECRDGVKRAEKAEAQLTDRDKPVTLKEMIAAGWLLDENDGEFIKAINDLIASRAASKKEEPK